MVVTLQNQSKLIMKSIYGCALVLME